MRLSFAAALFGAALVLAPAAPAQAPAAPTFVTTVGRPVPYRIDLPKGWASQQEDDMLTISGGNLMVLVAAADMLEGEENPLPVSRAESRRIFTNMVMGSDSLLLAMLRDGVESFTAEVDAPDVVQDFGTLAGLRAAHMVGSSRAKGQVGWFEMHVTMHDGILYMLAFAVKDDDPRDYQPIITRIRDSLVLAPAPQ